MIDWNDFILVQTIEFNDSDKNLPAPVDVKQIQKGLAFKFNKNNINPEFSFLIDAYHKGNFGEEKKSGSGITTERSLGKRGFQDFSNPDQNPPEFPSELKEGQSTLIKSNFQTVSKFFGKA